MATAADADLYRPDTSRPPYELLGVSYQNTQELAEKARAGLPASVIERLQKMLDVTASELYELVQLPQRTLYRRRQQGRLQPEESERVLRMARLYERAEDVLRNRERALRWLKDPHAALGGHTPVEYAGTELGAREVEDLLGRIAHGISF